MSPCTPTSCSPSSSTAARAGRTAGTAARRAVPGEPGPGRAGEVRGDAGRARPRQRPARGRGRRAVLMRGAGLRGPGPRRPSGGRLPAVPWPGGHRRAAGRGRPGRCPVTAALPACGPGRRHLDPVDLLLFAVEALAGAGWRPALHGLAEAVDAAERPLGACSVEWLPPARLADELLRRCERVESAEDGPCRGQVTYTAV